MKLKNLSSLCLVQWHLKGYHEESNLVDIWLYHESAGALDEIIVRSTGVGIGDVDKDAVNAFKNAFLNERYKGTNINNIDLFQNTYVKLEEVYQFIEAEGKYISKILFGEKYLKENA